MIKFVIYLLNIAYENSFFQQIANFINANDNLRELFVKELIEKLFCGRNVNMNFNNMSFMFRYIITAMKFSPIEIVLTLTERLKQKSNGGARTIHQSLQCAMLIGYIFDVLASKEMLNSIEKEKIVEVYEETYKAIEDQIEENVEKKKGMFREIKKMLNKIENYYDKTKENKKEKNLLMSVEGFKSIKEKINSIYETKIQIAKKEEEKKK